MDTYEHLQRRVRVRIAVLIYISFFGWWKEEEMGLYEAMDAIEFPCVR